MKRPACLLPAQRSSRESIIERLRSFKAQDANWKNGRTFSLVYYGTPEMYELVQQAYTLYMSENALAPGAFPSLAKMETEIVSMIAGLENGDENVVGALTTGGTESLLMTMLTAREFGRRVRGLEKPEVIVPSTAHPAFHKAGHYLDLRVVTVPVDPETYRVRIEDVQTAITPNTVMLVGSAPGYPFGVVDPIRELSELARDRGLLCHVDACIGGILLPFFRKLGAPVPDFDFALPGVTSMSVDLHKYAYAAKGASVILYRNAELRKHQYYVYTEWPGGLYGSPSMTGTRPGGAIAAAWAILNYMGEEGYLSFIGEIRKTTLKIIEAIRAIPGLCVLGNPDMSILALASDKSNDGVDVFQVADEMALRGWFLDRQQLPDSLHLSVMYAHAAVVDDFIRDLSESVERVRRSPRAKLTSMALRWGRMALKTMPASLTSKIIQRQGKSLGTDSAAAQKRSAAMYGMMGALPNRDDVNGLVMDYLNNVFGSPKGE